MGCGSSRQVATSRPITEPRQIATIKKRESTRGPDLWDNNNMVITVDREDSDTSGGFIDVQRDDSNVQISVLKGHRKSELLAHNTRRQQESSLRRSSSRDSLSGELNNAGYDIKEILCAPCLFFLDVCKHDGAFQDFNVIRDQRMNSLMDVFNDRRGLGALRRASTVFLSSDLRTNSPQK
jgi:hypothetical protein